MYILLASFRISQNTKHVSIQFKGVFHSVIYLPLNICTCKETCDAFSALFFATHASLISRSLVTIRGI